MTRDLKCPEFFSRKIFQIIAFSISIFLFLALFLFQAISHYTIYLSVYLPVLSLPISLYMSLSFFISMSHCSLYHLFLPLSLSFSSFLLMSASFLPSSNILSFMYRVLSKLCKCVDCKSMCLYVKTFVFSVCDVFFIFLP